jgi:hypothetical protein
MQGQQSLKHVLLAEEDQHDLHHLQETSHEQRHHKKAQAARREFLLELIENHSSFLEFLIKLNAHPVCPHTSQRFIREHTFAFTTVCMRLGFVSNSSTQSREIHEADA